MTSGTGGEQKDFAEVAELEVRNAAASRARIPAYKLASTDRLTQQMIQSTSGSAGESEPLRNASPSWITRLRPAAQLSGLALLCSIRQEHNLTYHTALAEQLLRLSSFGKRKAMRN